MNVEGGLVKYTDQNPDLPLARRASSHMILQEAIDTASTLQPPPFFPRSILFMHEFSPTHSGAKSNNLRLLRDRLDHSVKLPESACIPFQMAEYSLDLEPRIKN